MLAFLLHQCLLLGNISQRMQSRALNLLGLDYLSISHLATITVLVLFALSFQLKETAHVNQINSSTWLTTVGL